MTVYLLDACTIGAYLHRDAVKRTPRLVTRVEGAIREGGGARIAEIAAYEIRRGLRLLELRAGAPEKRRGTEFFLRQLPVVPVGPALGTAADLWARGQMLKPAQVFGEADLLAASCAMASGLVLLTTDEKLARGLGRIDASSCVEHVALR